MTIFDQLEGLDPTELLRQLERAKLYRSYPETGPLRRGLYGKHLEFFRATATHSEVAFIAGNRTGKSFAACYVAACSLIGWAPPWWEGRRFPGPIICWAAGEDAKAARESLQAHLLGPPGALGTGLIPGNLIERAPAKGGIPDAIDFAQIRHPKGTSRLVFKAYEQGRESFQGAHVDLGIEDEEPPMSIHTEFYTRTLSTRPGEPNGLLLCAFTPLRGISDVVLSFLPGGAMPVTVEQRTAAWGW
jgi:phage terminase large subunit-like protein